MAVYLTIRQGWGQPVYTAQGTFECSVEDGRLSPDPSGKALIGMRGNAAFRIVAEPRVAQPEPVEAVTEPVVAPPELPAKSRRRR